MRESLAKTINFQIKGWSPWQQKKRLQSKRSTPKAPSLIPLPEALSLARSKSTPY
jgi:hypothetical protein